jgi:cellulose synthase/poly-beta-1,6-N-acetylglucosamine synthase-like glycosyltransferase
MLVSDLWVAQSCNDTVEVKTHQAGRLLQRYRSTQLVTVGALLSLSGILLLLKLLTIVHSMSGAMDWLRLTEVVVLYGLFFWMLGCSLTYVIADIGNEKRQSTQILVSSAHRNTPACNNVAPLLLLIPSYKEEERIIRQALVSAALVECPRRRVVLLIDDPPYPTLRPEIERLNRSRQLVAESQRKFAAAAQPITRALLEFQSRQRRGKLDLSWESTRLTYLYDTAASWLETLSSEFDRTASHTNQLFVEKILLEPARKLRQRASDVAHTLLTSEDIAAEYHRLALLFRVEFSSFERKRYGNLSHRPNKAMNLNSYISLIGKSFVEVEGPDGLCLKECKAENATINVPSAPYIVMLDADSLITSDLPPRLIAVMEKPGNERIAVAQTPYTAIPKIPFGLERTAAASTDVQFFNHQGLAYFDSSWWVGASAVVRHSALEDIAGERIERGYKVKVYINDDILIEDAAATLDLLNHGWRVYHDPSRLSYSATPPDYGALIIQRRRWSNGGLLILPSLLHYVFRRPWSLKRFGEGLLRFQSLLSACFSGIGFSILLFYPFDDSLVPLWLPLATLPYYYLYATDLVLAGYRWTELPRIYALTTILLVPAYVSGTVQSLRQALSERPILFRRTPKIADRTPTPPAYAATILAMLLYGLCCFVRDLFVGRHSHAVFCIFTAAVISYGWSVLVGYRAARNDVLNYLPTDRMRWISHRRRSAELCEATRLQAVPLGRQTFRNVEPGCEMTLFEQEWNRYVDDPSVVRRAHRRRHRNAQPR